MSDLELKLLVQASEVREIVVLNAANPTALLQHNDSMNRRLLHVTVVRYAIGAGPDTGPLVSIGANAAVQLLGTVAGPALSLYDLARQPFFGLLEANRSLWASIANYTNVTEAVLLVRWVDVSGGDSL